MHYYWKFLMVFLGHIVPDCFLCAICYCWLLYFSLFFGLSVNTIAPLDCLCLSGLVLHFVHFCYGSSLVDDMLVLLQFTTCSFSLQIYRKDVGFQGRRICKNTVLGRYLLSDDNGQLAPL